MYIWQPYILILIRQSLTLDMVLVVLNLLPWANQTIALAVDISLSLSFSQLSDLSMALNLGRPEPCVRLVNAIPTEHLQCSTNQKRRTNGVLAKPYTLVSRAASQEKGTPYLCSDMTCIETKRRQVPHNIRIYILSGPILSSRFRVGTLVQRTFRFP